MPPSTKVATGVPFVVHSSTTDPAETVASILKAASAKRVAPDAVGSSPVDMVYLGDKSGLPTDEKALRELAKKIHAATGPPPGNGVWISDIPMPDIVPSEEQSEAEAAQNKWLAGLATSKAGQKLMDHLTHVEAAPHMRTSSAFEQASCFRRVLIHALSKKPRPFGLPAKLPKYMAIVNFSGERMFMYSDNPCLIAFLSMGSEGQHPSAAGVQKVLDHAVSTPHCSVLLCYSLPFQAGLDAAYWECRTVVRTSGNRIEDAHLVATSWEKTASKGTPTANAESQRTEILDAQEEAFSNNMMACDLDVEIEPIDGIDPAQVFDEKDGRLMKMITMLKNELKKRTEDHTREMEDLKMVHQLDVQKTTELVTVSFKKQAGESDQMTERIEQAETEVRMLRDALKGKERDMQQFKSDSMLKEEEIKAKSVQLQFQKDDLQKEVDKLGNHLKARDKEKQQELSKQAQAHRSITEQTERKLQSAKGDASQARQQAKESTDSKHQVERDAKKLAAAMDSVCAEKQHLTSQLTEARKELRSVKVRSSLACGRASKIHEMMQQARMAHAKAEEQITVLAKQVSEHTATSATIQEAAGAAAHESEELQKERDDLAGKVKALQTERDDALSAAAETAKVVSEKPKPVFKVSQEPCEFRASTGQNRAVDTEVVTEPTSFLCERTMCNIEMMTVPVMSKADMENCELKQEIATLNGRMDEKIKEVEQLKVDLGRAKQRGSKKPPPAGLLADESNAGNQNGTAVLGVPATSPGAGTGRGAPQTQVNIMVPAGANGGGPQQSVIDLGHEPGGDPMLEGTIAQLQMALRSVADMARTGKTHERNAQALHAKVQAYENMGMQGNYAYPPGQQQYMYAPPGGHGWS